jgi:hypothetical protein
MHAISESDRDNGVSKNAIKNYLKILTDTLIGLIDLLIKLSSLPRRT